MPLGGSGYLLYLHTLPTAALAKLCNALFLERAEEQDGGPHNTLVVYTLTARVAP